ncbi:hypothetical protein C1H46_018897 [Malus baccata]|uniref:Uncharacterized protein n=1 Tax=Malus baccata TaxID=106549 RepID=A0A540M9R7_MALBA|nr:hypothetical protein C1H46_018897 [Malus baccata]
MPKEESTLTILSERRITSRYHIRTSMALRSNQVTLIALEDSTCTDIHKPRLAHNSCFPDHFIIIGVCFRINYRDSIGQTNWLSFGMKA